jgi:hypothetical protein
MGASAANAVGLLAKAVVLLLIGLNESLVAAMFRVPQTNRGVDRRGVYMHPTHRLRYQGWPVVSSEQAFQVIEKRR